MIHSPGEALARTHTPQAIAHRIAAGNGHSYLGDVILGAIDGTVTTFAMVAGVAGANLPVRVAVILGLTNVFADGLSMAASNFLSTKSELELIERARLVEEFHVDTVPHGEREEVRQIFAGKGFAGELLERVVDVITQDRQRWIDTMLTEEHGLRLKPPVPWRAAASTFVAFAIAGQIPLLPLFWSGQMTHDRTFAISTAATAIAFFSIGVAKGVITQRRWLLSGLETLAVGGLAAGVAYAVGLLLQTLAIP